MVGLLGCGCCGGCEGATPTITDDFQPPDMTIWNRNDLTSDGRVFAVQAPVPSPSVVSTIEETESQPFRFGFSSTAGGINLTFGVSLGPNSTQMSQWNVPPPALVTSPGTPSGFHQAYLAFTATIWFRFWDQNPPSPPGFAYYYDTAIQFEAGKKVWQRNNGVETQYYWTLNGASSDMNFGFQRELEYSRTSPVDIPTSLDVRCRYPASLISADRKKMWEIKQAKCPAIQNGSWVDLRTPANIPRSNYQPPNDFVWCAAGIQLAAIWQTVTNLSPFGPLPVNFNGTYLQFLPLTWQSQPTP